MNILISGAGPAGLTLAYWLEKNGHKPTVVEKAPALRSAGYMIDFAGTGWDVARRMNLLPEMKKRAYPIDSIFYRDGDDRVLAQVKVRQILENAKVADKYAALNRADLVDMLYQIVKDGVEIRFGTSISKLKQDNSGVTAELSSGTRETYDLAIGADGIHSHIRTMVFGDAVRFTRYLGYQFVLFEIAPLALDLGDSYHMFVEPGLQIGIYPTDSKKWMIFAGFASANPEIPPPEQRLYRLKQLLGTKGWHMPAILESLQAGTPVFWDTVSQIVMPRWCRERVGLIGDAAHCPTLFSGQGASMAMGGAYLFAQALGTANDYARAFDTMESSLRPHIERTQKAARSFAPSFIPSTKFRIGLIHAVLRLSQAKIFRGLVGKQFAVASILE